MLFLAALLLTLATATVVGCYSLLLYSLHKRMSRIPGPPRTSFFLGHLSEIVKAKKEGTILEDRMFQWHLDYGYTIVVFIFHKYFIWCIDPNIIKNVLLQNPRTFPKGPNYSHIGYLFGVRGLGEGVFTQRDYDVWAMQRLALNPAFHRKFVAGLVSGFNDTAARLTDCLSDFSGTGQSVDLSDYFQRAANDVISQVIFGQPPADLRTDNSPLQKAANGVVSGFSIGLTSAFPDWSPFLRTERNDYIRHVKAIKATATDAIRRRMAALENQEDIPEDILSVIVKAHAENAQFTMDLILDNMATFFVAGQETTANTLAFVFMELGRNPNVLQKVADEVRSCIGNKQTVSYEDTCSMKYCTMAIKETLRLHPVATATVRYIKDGATYGDIQFPPDCLVLFSAYSCGRHPDFHKDPELFNPDRFDPEVEERVPQVAYYPFSLGPRSCIGQNFAMTMMKVVIAKFLQRLEYDLDKSRPFIMDQATTLCPRDGLWVTISDR